jgi:hypothetical protein
MSAINRQVAFLQVNGHGASQKSVKPELSTSGGTVNGDARLLFA